MEGNAEEITFVDAPVLGEEIIVKSGRRFRDQSCVRVKSLAKMELVQKTQALVNARKAGRENFVIRGRTKRKEAQQKRKIAINK